MVRPNKPRGMHYLTAGGLVFVGVVVAFVLLVYGIGYLMRGFGEASESKMVPPSEVEVLAKFEHLKVYVIDDTERNCWVYVVEDIRASGLSLSVVPKEKPRGEEED